MNARRIKRSLLSPLCGNIPLITRISAHGTHRHLRGMRIIVIKILIHLDVLMIGIAVADLRRQNHTLMIVSASAIALAVGAALETPPISEAAPDTAPMWRVVVRTVTE